MVLRRQAVGEQDAAGRTGGFSTPLQGPLARALFRFPGGARPARVGLFLYYGRARAFQLPDDSSIAGLLRIRILRAARQGPSGRFGPRIFSCFLNDGTWLGGLGFRRLFDGGSGSSTPLRAVVDAGDFPRRQLSGCYRIPK